jgi:hypothetical protein
MQVDVEYYVKVLKEHEVTRTSTNERQQFWDQYRKRQRNLDEETGFDMNRFSDEIR